MHSGKNNYCAYCGSPTEDGLCPWCDEDFAPAKRKKSSKKGLAVLLVVFVLVLGAAAVLYGQLSQTQTGGVQQADSGRELAPNFTVYDAEGNPVQLSDFRGKPVVLNFWASWCGPCRMEMPEFAAEYEARKGEVVFLMVNATGVRGETQATAQAFVDSNGYSFPIYFDTQWDAAAAYGVYSYPTTVFIDADGGIAGGRIGAISGDVLRQGIDSAS